MHYGGKFFRSQQFNHLYILYLNPEFCSCYKYLCIVRDTPSRLTEMELFWYVVAINISRLVLVLLQSDIDGFSESVYN